MKKPTATKTEYYNFYEIVDWLRKQHGEEVATSFEEEIRNHGYYGQSVLISQVFGEKETEQLGSQKVMEEFDFKPGDTMELFIEW